MPNGKASPALESLGIDEKGLEWRLAGEVLLQPVIKPDVSGGMNRMLLQAKALVANDLNVPIEAVEITIRL